MASETDERGVGGRERRRHRMYVTRNSEYHFRDQTCVGVRDRTTGRFLREHSALRRDLSGVVRFQPNGVAIPVESRPQVGEALYFGSGGRALVTSSLTAVERPPKSALSSYCAV